MEMLSAEKLRLITTGECNLACFYCHNEGQSDKRYYLDELFVGRLCSILAAADATIREVTISGGEPTLHPSLLGFVRHARTLTPNVTMVSNGVLIDEALLTELAASGLCRLRLGLDSLRPDKSRPSPGHTRPRLSPSELIEAAVTAGIEVDLNVVLTRFNAREIADLVRLAALYRTNVKFFEHVDVEQFSSPGGPGAMVSRPHVPLASFRSELARLGDVFELPPDPMFGAANLRYQVAGVEVRYCRFLCPYSLCWATGTRIDPSLFVYNCMLNHGMDRLSRSVLPSRVLEVLSQASSRPCNARARTIRDPIRR